MSRPVAFPMYDIDRDNTEALTRAVIALLQERAVATGDVTPEPPPDDLLAHWQQPGLLLSQACGYPLMTALRRCRSSAVFTMRHRAARACTTVAFWWYATKINTPSLRIIAIAGRYITLRTRSLATMR